MDDVETLDALLDELRVRFHEVGTHGKKRAAEMLERIAGLEHDLRDMEGLVISAERQASRLANLYVAAYQLHASLDPIHLAAATSGLTLRSVNVTALAEIMAEGRARIIEHSPRTLPEELREIVDRPKSGQAAVFPVLGSRRVIALIYADNGRHDRAIDDVEIMEIATAQVGLAFENELLRRQIDRQEERRA
jgi:hypothetical protein